MKLSKGVKRQLKISAWIVVLYALALAVYFQRDAQSGFMAGDSLESSGPAPYTELTWEILVLDPENRMKLWARYDKSSESEREKAFLAVIHVIQSLSPEQAEYLAKNLLEKSGNARNSAHRKKLLEMLERLGSKFTNSMKHIAAFSARSVSHASESNDRKRAVQEMMENIARETKDTGYKYCLQGEVSDISTCAEQLAAEKHPKAEEHLKNFVANSQMPEARGAVLIVVSQNKIPFGKEFVSQLLSSENAYDIRVALRLVREYELVEYRQEVQKLRKSKFESVVQDVDQTLAYLATRSTASQ